MGWRMTRSAGTIKRWARHCDEAVINRLLPLHKPLSSYSGFTPEQRQSIGGLSTACARTSQSILLLTAYEQLWDADILVRSVIEGTLKFIYLLSSGEEFPTRLREYTEDLFEIGLAKNHVKAQELLKSVPDPSADMWRPIRDLILEDAELDEIRTRFDRQTRAKLEQRWGFTGLVAELAKQPWASTVSGLLHSYSICSHIHHVDFQGVSVMMDRGARPEDRRDAVHLAHASRLVSEVFEFALLRTSVAYRFVHADPEHLRSVRDFFEQIRPELSAAQAQFHEVEYVKHRRGRKP